MTLPAYPSEKTMLPLLFASLSLAATPNDLTLKGIDGKKIPNETFENKATLFVNVASKCGYTRQYEPLEALYKQCSDKDFVILGFPCNQFGMQEPGSSDDIRDFCSKNYGVSFQMMSKVKVKGAEQHPVYAWLTKKELNGSGDHSVRWNFSKFLVNEQGELVAALGSGADPLGEEIIAFAEGS